ncbi:hypothetical protein [Metamycoplasma alkalescens]|uniref:Variable surface lipoprotein n=2 Tax=Metamycoplasma alkalescens TaxID=45363 RepID=A0A318U766_9BACT|nr:hypothetical protein [Metamycoplasma alkalescens]PYF42557.1 hypothetical protein BCF88_11012 [Metamycoplasma alkalescens]SYV90442.1 Uncharacterised protein [Metamycoplasma alkalescens]
MHKNKQKANKFKKLISFIVSLPLIATPLAAISCGDPNPKPNNSNNSNS